MSRARVERIIGAVRKAASSVAYRGGPDDGDALETDPSDTASLDELGRRVGASTRTLSRLFARELGMTFYHWRSELRVHHALVLLAQGHSTTDSAHRCGWTNPSAFITAFRRIVGITPSHYRTLHRNS